MLEIMFVQHSQEEMRFLVSLRLSTFSLDSFATSYQQATVSNICNCKLCISVFYVFLCFRNTITCVCCIWM